MKSNPLSILAIIIATVSLLGTSLYFGRKTNSAIQSNSSELVTWANEMYPLDNQHKYIIKKNSKGNFGQGEYIVPEGSFYVIEIPGEDEPEMQHMTSGRKIGSTAIDLAKYENKMVNIEGKHYLGKPMFLINEYDLPMFIRSNQQAVIHIQSVKTEEDTERINHKLDDLNSR